MPDVLVRKIKEEWVLTINQAVMPSLRISEGYESMIRRLGKEAGSGMTEQLAAAKGFMRQVSQRFTTILDVSRAIMDKQRDFLEYGMARLQPLTLRDVADAVGMHESTISRATTQKFIATPHGVFELKRFFGSGVATDSGENASATAVQIRIRNYIQAEPEGKPLSDSRLTDLLAQEGITIARRTVAKYREVLGIPSASLRKARASLNQE
ncbi:RNA polymerase factor sigma-54 [Advenella kashmirensis WT001]|uniref:RNA polymerase factor sigma-54 n=1 Tax=Advenella kashmirensis (strain DSM 17095 / LMG 22695 / WT001) TaxID=1036672 RepID=I3U7W4_ADVKW|nr:RNA polymerase factor sigma-54 [Advenella kashmirensis WT001]